MAIFLEKLFWGLISTLIVSTIGIIKKVWDQSKDIEALQKENIRLNQAIKDIAKDQKDSSDSLQKMEITLAVLNALIPRLEKALDKMEDKK